MPELPDVQVSKEYVDATALHQRITGVHPKAGGLRESVSDSTLRRRLDGRRFASARRHGKHLFLEVEDDGWLRLHFGMTGFLSYYRDREEAADGGSGEQGGGSASGGGAGPPDRTKLLLDFPDGYHLAYVNVRKFGEIGFVDDVDDFVAEHGLGPDAMELDPEGFRERLAGRRGTIKGTLMNQEVLAGLGNVYTDEILFRAGVHPRSKTDELAEETVGRLYEAMQEVVEGAVGARAQPDEMPDDFLVPRREEGAECPRCGAEIEKTEVSGRPTYFCPREQERP